MIDELASEKPAAKIGKVNIDDNPGVAQRFGISKHSNTAGLQRRRSCREFRRGPTKISTPGRTERVAAVNLSS